MANVETAAAAPSEEQFSAAMVWFVNTAAQVVVQQSEQSPLDLFGESANEIAGEFSNRAQEEGLGECYAELENASPLALRVYYQELLYICWKYGRGYFDAGSAMLEPDVYRAAEAMFGGLPADDSADSETVVGDVETVIESAKNLMTGLPLWAKAFMELLKELMNLVRRRL